MIKCTNGRWSNAKPICKGKFYFLFEASGFLMTFIKPKPRYKYPHVTDDNYVNNAVILPDLKAKHAMVLSSAKNMRCEGLLANVNKLCFALIECKPQGD